MSIDDIIQLIGLFALIVLPSMAIAVRIAIKPMVDAILRLREGLQPEPAQQLADPDRAELARLGGEILQLRRTVARLEEANTFYQTLLQPAVRVEEDPPASSPQPSQ